MGRRQNTQTCGHNHYGGTLNWDRIYDTCHDAPQIAARLDAVLGPQILPVIFAGFPRAAADLAKTRPVIFVDRSGHVIASARQKYPALRSAQAADIFDAITAKDTSHIVISGRLSAFWQTPSDFDMLDRAIAAHSRNRILIDFFDRDAVCPGQVFRFGTGHDSGRWVIGDIRHRPGCDLPIFHVAKKIEYRSRAGKANLEVERSFFRRADILAWAEARFPNWHCALHPALIENDPSFSLSLST